MFPAKRRPSPIAVRPPTSNPAPTSNCLYFLSHLYPRYHRRPKPMITNKSDSTSSRKRKRGKKSRGGIGCSPINGTNDTSTELTVDIVPLSNHALHLLSKASNEDGKNKLRLADRRRVRIVHPYPYTFATFAKARWIGRTVLDVYDSEFGAS